MKKIFIATKLDQSVIVHELIARLNHKELRDFILMVDCKIQDADFTRHLIEALEETI